MRITITLADDVAAAVDKIRSERSIGLSQAVNDLVRAGLPREQQSAPFVQRTHAMGGVDYTNVADAIETLDRPVVR